MKFQFGHFDIAMRAALILVAFLGIFSQCSYGSITAEEKLIRWIRRCGGTVSEHLIGYSLQIIYFGNQVFHCTVVQNKMFVQKY